MNKKILYLLVALVLPILIFIFLKFFGKNQFDIPVYYQNGVIDASSECAVAKGQYYLPDSLLQSLGWNKGNAILLIGTNANEKHELTRLMEEEREYPQVISMDHLPASQLDRLKKCVFFLKDPWKVILIDDQKRIRGYYTLNSREELDRLEVELKILLKKY